MTNLSRSPSCIKWGTHREFADLYEPFLDAAYDSPANVAPGNGRWLLIRQLANEIRLRGAREILDCAVGTGYSILSLAANASNYGIDTLHVTDGDQDMIRVLRRRAAKLGVNLPPVGPAIPDRQGSSGRDPLLCNWADLDQLPQSYDYVLCRGNSLAYADTWTGETKVASHTGLLDYLSQIASKVKRGGYLHVDAPWQARLQQRKYRPVASGAVSIWEEVTTEVDYRHWRVGFKLPSGHTLKFERFSSALTIGEVSDALEDMGFEDTKPFDMPGERANFGVIIAHRPGA